MKQKDVYKALGIPNNTYSNYENGKREPDLKTLVCIADFLDVSVDYLLGREDKKVDSNACSDNIRKMEIPNVGIFTPVFSDKIKELRHIINMTQRELASELGVTQQTICKWENSIVMPSYEMLIKISYLFNVTTDYLLGRNDDPSQQQCNMDKQEKRSTLCDKELRRAFQIGVDDHQSGVPCILKSSINVKVLLSKFESNSLACALIAEAWVKGWMHDAMQI